jgi:hypothetical protein
MTTTGCRVKVLKGDGAGSVAEYFGLFSDMTVDFCKRSDGGGDIVILEIVCFCFQQMLVLNCVNITKCLLSPVPICMCGRS